MEKLAEHNNGYKYLLVAVDTLSQNTRVEALKSKTSEETCRAFKQMVNFEHLDFPIKVWVDLGKEFKGSFKISVMTMKLKYIALIVRQKAQWLKGIYVR